MTIYHTDATKVSLASLNMIFKVFCVAAACFLGAIFMVHWGRWNFMPAEGFPAGGMEFQVVLLLTALYFLVMGNSGSSRTN